LILNRILGLLLGLLLAFVSVAQVFEWTENKGQWNPVVKFKGELSLGAFFLTEQGYRVVQHHSGDYAYAMEQLTGHNLRHQDNKPFTRPMAAVDNSLNNELAGTVSDPVRSHAYDMVFEGRSSQARFLPEKPMAGYSNFFLGSDSSRWRGGVKSYAVVVYQNVYPNIDVRYYSEEGYLKFDIIVHPGGRVEDIRMRYIGVDKLELKEGALQIHTSVSVVTEKEPYTYQLGEAKRLPVPCSYVVSGNLVTFKTGRQYDRNSTLVIDPTLVFSTFAGSNVSNWGYTATFDAQGNAYGGGIAFGNGFPVTTGAFQSAFNGGNSSTGEGSGFDMVLMKLNPNGTQRIFGTYLGGSGNEQPHSLVVDNAGNLIVSGRTTSTNFPVSTGGRYGRGGGWDIVVTKFNTTGTGIVGSVILGGISNDGVNIKHKATAPTGPLSLFQNYGDDARSEVIADAAGNIYIASCTRSDTFPTTPGVLQTQKQGDQDAVLLKFAPNMSLTFSTLLGGSGDDAAYVVLLEENGNILLAGGTSSNNFPGDKSGTVGSTYFGGVADGFIARISNDGSVLQRTIFVGTTGVDQIYGIQKDRNGFVYAMGTSTSNYPVRNAAFSNPGGKQFIVKFTTDFSAFVYSTVFGTVGTTTTNPNISPTAFLVDRCENVYVSGWGGQIGSERPYPNSLTNGLPVTTDAIQNTTDGNDFYFFVLEKDAVSQLYGSFFGQRIIGQGVPDHVDGGTSRFDPQGVIYQGMCANCTPGQFPTTPGVIAPTRPNSATCNLAVVKINFDLSGVIGGIKSSIDGVDGDSIGCVPSTVVFRDTIGIARSYQWNFGDGTPEVTTTVPTISHNYTRVGFFRARLIAVDESRCFPRDTSFVLIRVRPDRITLGMNPVKLDPCESNTYRFENTSTPVSPISPYTDSSFVWDFGDNSPRVRAGRNSITHRFPAPGTYNVRLVLVDTNYCNAPDSINIQLRVSPFVNAAFETPAIGCAPYTASFNNTSAGGQTFFWDFGNGNTSTAINPTTFYGVPGTYRVKLIARDPSTCNLVDSTFFTIRVEDKPIAAFTFSPNPPEENILVTFNNQSEQTSLYIWAFGDGDTLRTTKRDTLIRHQYPATGTYTACLITVDENGCSDTVCQTLAVIINPLVDVVTAFTPNGDGVNDNAIVFGFGVQRMIFRIFNRWGQLVFESRDPRVGWDGNFKGKPQPMDGYAFTLEADLINGESIRKSGSITLVR